ncbi:hypothetical protein Y032_1038g3465 [Ancylostoma ceylanicum]|nr:hypothetical protein Y032_1038g3465 [Ancylostoma ceylanicum]
MYRKLSLGNDHKLQIKVHLYIVCDSESILSEELVSDIPWSSTLCNICSHSLKFFEDEARSLSSKEKENLSVIYHHSSLIHVKSDRGSTTYEGHVSRADLPIVFDYFLYPNQRWAKFSRIPAARTPADATGFAALVNQAALLQQVSGGGINLHASTAFAALFNSVMQVPQQNVLRVIGRVLVILALDVLTEGGSGAVNASAVSGNSPA